ncbi:PHOsphatase [Linnemannia zychae]|nr:PHOsphatase [Linnemannia zychae]
MSVAQASPESRTLSQVPTAARPTGLFAKRKTAVTILLPSVALFLAVSSLYSPALVHAASSAVVDRGNSIVERSTVLGNGEIQPQTEILASLVLSHRSTATGQDGVLRHGFSAGTTFTRDGTVVVVAQNYRDNTNESAASHGGDDRRCSTAYTLGPESASASAEAREYELEQDLELRGPAIAEIEDRLAQSLDPIGRLPPKTMSLIGSSPLYSLPPKEWIRSHLGTKSPYPHESRPVGLLKDTPKGYELVQLHLINRHGTRYPSASKSVSFKALADRLKGVKLRGFEWLRDWPSETLYPPMRGNLLSAQGDSDLYQIGRRFAIRYRTFLDKYPYDASTYEFTSSAKSRCSQSAYAFSVGFFEGRLTYEPGFGFKKGGHRPPIQPVEISMLPIGLDKELAVKYACPRWLESVKDSPNVVKESKLYESKFLPAIAERLTAVLSAGAETPSARVNITAKDVGAIQNICGFEISMHNDDKTWCRLLGLGLEGSQKSDAKAVFENFEIAGDLDDYYTHGPGIPFNRHLGCKLGTSLVEGIEMILNEDGSTQSAAKKPLDDDEDGPKKYRGLFKFGHSETILFFSSFLGLYNQNGVPMTANMTAEQYENREFKTSSLSPFSANMAFEVYRPTAGTNPNKRRRLNDDATVASASADPTAAPRGLVRLLVNEVPMAIPGCDGKLFCEWSTFKQVLEKAGSGCDFDGCCSTLLPQPAPAVAAAATGFRAAAVSMICRSQAPMVLAEKPAQVCLAIEPIVEK